jgi:hypothetical protein
VIGNSLRLSPSFPPLHTVHDSFPSHGVPSQENFNQIYTFTNSLLFRLIRIGFSNH